MDKKILSLNILTNEITELFDVITLLESKKLPYDDHTYIQNCKILNDEQLLIFVRPLSGEYNCYTKVYLIVWNIKKNQCDLINFLHSLSYSNFVVLSDKKLAFFIKTVIWDGLYNLYLYKR